MITVPKRIDLIKALKPGSIGVEVGTCRGWFAIEILNHSRIGKLFCVDAWSGQTPGEDFISEEQHEANLAECKHHVRGHMPGGRIEIVRMRSLDASEKANIPPLDFVYIDAAHDYDSCLADLIAWSKKLKPTGVILGHDFTANESAKKWNFGVIEAVRDFCEKYGWVHTHLTDEDFASYRLEPKAWTGAEL